MTQTISKKRVESIIIPPGNLYQEKRISQSYDATLLCTTCEEDSMYRVPGTRVYVCEICGAVEYR